MATEYLSVAEYAALYRKNEQSVRDMCASGRIPAEKVGKTWRIPHTDHEAIEAQAREELGRIIDAAVQPAVRQIDTTIATLMEIKGALEDRRKVHG